uniref:Uncharacterized protein n=1 Tax=Tanacetum cinerariifolium TaxID=118510 RepID=A0A6L2LMZ6_TANCI|nr:hypothetical protein [Tanacetum cinerariifolium]
MSFGAGVTDNDDDSNDDDNYDDSDDDGNNVKDDDDHEQADDERTKSDDEEEEKQDDKYVHTPDYCVPTDEETNDESKESNEEEYKELYGDVNISLKDAELADIEKGDVEMTNIEIGDAELENVNQEGEVVSMLDINVQHEVPRTSPLFTITVSRITNLEKDIKELKTVDHSLALLSTIKSEVPKAVKEYLRISLDDSLQRVLQKYSADLAKEHSIPADKAVTDRLCWNNPKEKEYMFDLSKPLPLIMNQGLQVVPVDYFINNDLEYLRGGSSSKKYTTSTTKTNAAKFDISRIKNKVPSLWSLIKRIIAVTKVKVMKWYDYGYLEEIKVQREDQQLYKFKEDLGVKVVKKVAKSDIDNDSSIRQTLPKLKRCCVLPQKIAFCLQEDLAFCLQEDLAFCLQEDLAFCL